MSTTRLRFALLATVAAVSPAALLAGAAVLSPIVRADAPGAGESCTKLHATAKDVNGRTLWCNPTMTGAQILVWQYGGPS
jgi:hypothetical protein